MLTKGVYISILAGIVLIAIIACLLGLLLGIQQQKIATKNFISQTVSECNARDGIIIIYMGQNNTFKTICTHRGLLNEY